MDFYNEVCKECSTLVTKRYSTSFSMGIRVFDKKYRAPIYSIYGFVRFADEIVDTFHNYDKEALLEDFRKQTFDAISSGISLNPILQSFQEVVNEYNIDHEFIEAFLDSMAMDLDKYIYDQSQYKQYIYGSAEVVGLMCLRVFCKGDDAEFQKLKPFACSLGSAFQKINFLRDMKSDYDERGRVYFPKVDFTKFSDADKRIIEEDINKDFEEAYKGIVQLPRGARCGVYLAYVYYTNLFKKIRKAGPEQVTETRMRINDGRKMILLFSSFLKHRFNLM